MRRGSILTVSVMGMALLSVMASGLYSLSLGSMKEVARQRDSMEAFYVAQTGINEMVSLLISNYDNKDDPSVYPQGSLGRGSYSVKITQPAGTVLIESTGTVRQVPRLIYLQVKYEGKEAFDYGVFSNGDLSMTGNSQVSADAQTNTNLLMTGDSEIEEDAHASGTITAIGNANVEGEQISGAEPVSFPTFDFNYYYNLAQSGGLYYEGDQSFTNQNLAPSNGIIYVNGDVTLLGSSTVTGAVIATGSIEVLGNVVQTQVGSYPAFMSRDSGVTLTGNAQADGLVYTASGDVVMTGNAVLDGQIISYGTTMLTGNAIIDYEESPTAPGLTPESSPLKRLTYYYE